MLSASPLPLGRAEKHTPLRRKIQILRHPNLISNFYGFVYFAVSRVGEGTFLLGKEGSAEEKECGEFWHFIQTDLQF